MLQLPLGWRVAEVHLGADPASSSSGVGVQTGRVEPAVGRVLAHRALHLQRPGFKFTVEFLAEDKANLVNIAAADACMPALHQAAWLSIPAQAVSAAQGEEGEEEQGQCSSGYLNILAESLS